MYINAIEWYCVHLDTLKLQNCPSPALGEGADGKLGCWLFRQIKPFGPQQPLTIYGNIT